MNFSGVVGLLVIEAVIGLVVMYSGVVNVGATEPHSGFTRYILSTTMDNSVHRHAKDIRVPPLDKPGMVLDGFRHYREMCVVCHLAPGMKSTEVREGLRPEPPKLYEGLDEWKPNELFWIVKNGVKMTGMPAWGPTHSDEKIWAIVAFLEKLPHMNAAQYKAMDKQAGPAGGDEHDHDHGAAGGDRDHGNATDHPH
jgi:mono/diheme cytochrome c family protein